MVSSSSSSSCNVRLGRAIPHPFSNALFPFLFSVPLDLHVCVLCRRLNVGNRARLSAGGFDATVKKKEIEVKNETRPKFVAFWS